MKKVICLILSVLMLATCFVGCGAKENSDLAAIKKAGKIQMTTNAEFEPFEYKDGDKYAGIDMEIAAYIAEKLDMELVIVDMEFESVVTSVGKNNIDVAMAGLTVNDTRKQSVDFTDSYYEAAQMLIVPESETAFDDCETADEVLAVLKALLG